MAGGRSRRHGRACPRRGNQALPRPAEPHLALWQATTTLREHRGDGHVAVLVARGIAPVHSHIIKAAVGEADPDVRREGRRFPEREWTDGLAELRRASLLDGDARLTAAGRRLHEQVEANTDTAAESPWRALGPTGTAWLVELLDPLAGTVLRSGTLPTPNPGGLVVDPAGS